jgi:hypothetical protein
MLACLVRRRPARAACPAGLLKDDLGIETAAAVMTRVAGEHHLEYELTPKGAALWPVVLSLMSWRCFRGVPTAWDLPDDVRGRRERPMRTALDEEASQRIACHSGTGLLSASGRFRCGAAGRSGRSGPRSAGWKPRDAYLGRADESASVS